MPDFSLFWSFTVHGDPILPQGQPTDPRKSSGKCQMLLPVGLAGTGDSGIIHIVRRGTNMRPRRPVQEPEIKDLSRLSEPDARVTMGVVENVDDPFSEHHPDPHCRRRSGGGNRPGGRIRGQAKPQCLSARNLSGSVRQLPLARHRRLLQGQRVQVWRWWQSVPVSLLQSSRREAVCELPGRSPGGSLCRISLRGLPDGRMPAHGVAVGSSAFTRFARV